MLQECAVAVRCRFLRNATRADKADTRGSRSRRQSRTCDTSINKYPFSLGPRVKRYAWSNGRPDVELGRAGALDTGGELGRLADAGMRLMTMNVVRPTPPISKSVDRPSERPPTALELLK